MVVLMLAVQYIPVKTKSMPGSKITGNQAAKKLDVSTVNEVISLIQSKDFNALSDFVSDKGLIVKPYYTPNQKQGRILTKDVVASFFNDVAVREWGVQDGSGLPLKMTDLQYYEKFIYPHNFLKLAKVSYDASLVNGNTLPLDEVLKELFPNSNISYAEYYISGIDPKYDGMDWGSLALIFENISGDWKLVGILHNEWTI